MDIVSTEKSKYLIDRHCHCHPSSSSDPDAQSVLNPHWKEQHLRSQMQVQKQVVDHPLKLLTEEGTPRLEGGILPVGRVA
jgi:hypothetical protein